MTIGSGIAVVGIWLGVGIVAMSGAEAAVVAALPAVIATMIVAAR